MRLPVPGRGARRPRRSRRSSRRPARRCRPSPRRPARAPPRRRAPARARGGSRAASRPARRRGSRPAAPRPLTPRGGHRRAEGDVARAAVVAAAPSRISDEARVRERDRLAPQGRVDARDQLGVVAVQQALGLVGHRVEVRPQGAASRSARRDERQPPFHASGPWCSRSSCVPSHRSCSPSTAHSPPTAPPPRRRTPRGCSPACARTSSCARRSPTRFAFSGKAQMRPAAGRRPRDHLAASFRADSGDDRTRVPGARRALRPAARSRRCCSSRSTTTA